MASDSYLLSRQRVSRHHLAHRACESLAEVTRPAAAADPRCSAADVTKMDGAQLTAPRWQHGVVARRSWRASHDRRQISGL